MLTYTDAVEGEITLTYTIQSFDPLAVDGTWRGTDICIQMLNKHADDGWAVQQQWLDQNGIWYFLFVRESVL